MEDTRKYMLAGTGIVATGFLFWYLSQDESTCARFDKNTHTLEKLRLIIREIFIESSILYCQKLNLIRRLQTDGNFNKERLEQIK